MDSGVAGTPAVTGSPQFALAYASNTATAVRAELGGWLSRDFLLADGNLLAVFGRAAWAHDHDSNLVLTPSFLALPAARACPRSADDHRDPLNCEMAVEHRMVALVRECPGSGRRVCAAAAPSSFARA